MNLQLIRLQRESFGIFSELHDESQKVIAVTLEHAYGEAGAWCAKIPAGVFTCRRGQHRLENMAHPFATFEITGVAGHTNLLFHCGNFNKDSEGCILLGRAIAQDGAAEMVVDSVATFDKFMQMQTGLDTFTLTVID